MESKRMYKPCFWSRSSWNWRRKSVNES